MGETETKILRQIERWNVALSALLIVATSIFIQRTDVRLGVLVGALIACANFAIISRLARKMIVARSKGLLLAVLFMKMLGLFVVVGICLRYLPIHPVAFMVGLCIFLASIFIAAIKVTLAQAAQQEKVS